MSAISSTPTSFPTFHSGTTTIPAEITSHIIEYVIADTQLLPMGGGVGMRRAHHPLASTSHALQTNYLRHPYPTTAKHRTTAPIHLNLGEALYFNDLRTHRTQNPSMAQGTNTQKETLSMAATRCREPGASWTALVPHRDGWSPWRKQFEWLNARYKYLYDRETVAARLAAQRIAYHKRRRRWPILSKQRRKRSPR
jgi:hypothetical protein